MKGRKTGQVRLQEVKNTKKAKEAKEEREVRDQEAHVGHAEDPISRGSARKHLRGRGNSSSNSMVIMETRGVSGANGGPMEIVDAEAHQRKRTRPNKEKETVNVHKARGRWMRVWGT